MVVTNPKKSVFDCEALSNFLIQENIKPIHAFTIQQFVANTHQPYLLDFTHLQNVLPKHFIPKLQSEFGLITKVIQKQHSHDGNTTKLMIQLPNASCIETVVMHYDRQSPSSLLEDKPPLSSYSFKENSHLDPTTAPPLKKALKPRTTVCLSSQVGCKMACSFCATGTMGFHAHLTSAEIIEQVVHANHVRSCSNMVFMGMGEPFDNYNAVCAAIHFFTKTNVFAFGPKHICVSTVGVVPKMYQFTTDCPGVHLALSLHAPSQKCREILVPTAKNYTLDKLMMAVDHYLKLHDRIMIEYILIRHLNSTPSCAHELGDLLSTRSVILNLIPYNPTSTNDQYEAPTSDEIHEFESILRSTYKIRTTVRRTMGQDIDGACGQLVLNATSSSCASSTTTTSSSSSSPSSLLVTDIEDVGLRCASVPASASSSSSSASFSRRHPSSTLRSTGASASHAASSKQAHVSPTTTDASAHWLRYVLVALFIYSVFRICSKHMEMWGWVDGVVKR